MERQQEENGGVQQASEHTCGLVVRAKAKFCPNIRKTEETQTTGLVQRKTDVVPNVRSPAMTHPETCKLQLVDVVRMYFLPGAVSI